MLLGAEINIYTDHDNLTYEKFRSQRVLQWRLYIKEFAPKIQHIPGKQNNIADALSRLPFEENINNENKTIYKMKSFKHFIIILS